MTGVRYVAAKVIFGLALIGAPLSAWANSQAIIACYEQAGNLFEKRPVDGAVGLRFRDIKAETAVTACRKAIEISDDPANQYRLSRALVAAGDTRPNSEAFILAKAAADRGYGPAMQAIGYLLSFRAKGQSPEAKQGFEWMKKSAETGFVPAFSNLSYQYNLGIGTPKDAALAVRYAKMAADAGDETGSIYMGIYTQSGMHVAKDMGAARQWYLKAARTGNPEAQTRFANTYLKKGMTDQEGKLALEWYQKAAQSNYKDAIYNLGYMHGQGVGTPKNQVLAHSWYLKGAELGDERAQLQVGYGHFTGTGTLRDLAAARLWYLSATRGNLVGAQYAFGLMALHGQGGPVDFALARHHLQIAVEKGEERAAFPLAEAYILSDLSTEHHEKAVGMFKAQAKAGSAPAAWRLGTAYENGRGVTKNLATALRFYEQAKAGGYAAAEKSLQAMKKGPVKAKPAPKKTRQQIQLTLDNAYFEALKLRRAKRYNEAFRSLVALASRDYTEAWHTLGHMHELGQGTPKDLNAAHAKFVKAGNLGHMDSMRHVADAKLDGEIVAKDVSGALGLLEKAVALGDAKSMRDLGKMYYFGQNVPANDKRALDLFEAAFSGGEQSVRVYIGFILWKGADGVPKNTERAFNLLKEVATEGETLAQYYLGRMLLTGAGRPVDPVAAQAWLLKAAEQGYVKAQYNVARNYQLGRGVDKNASEAVKWYEHAAKQGHTTSQTNLGSIYYNGDIVPKNRARAIEWTRKAAANGNKTAQKNLKIMLK